MKPKRTDFAREGVMKFLSNSYLAQDFPCSGALQNGQRQSGGFEQNSDNRN